MGISIASGDTLSCMERRDFFGILAAPLLRRFLPPEPVAFVGGFVPSDEIAILHTHENLISREMQRRLIEELGVEDSQSVIDAMYPESA